MEYYTLVNHTREEKINPHSINRGAKIYQWLSEVTSSIGMYLLLNGGFNKKSSIEYGGSWSECDVELMGESVDKKCDDYTDITQDVFEELENNFEDFPSNMESEFAKSVLSEY